MKNTTIIFLAIAIAFVSCGKDEITSVLTDPNDTLTTENPTALWEYEFDQIDVLLTDLVVDNNDNSYFFAKANEEYVLYSLDKEGALRWSSTIPFGSYLNSGIMLAGDKLILSYQYDVVAAYNLNDGSQIWSTTLTVSYSDMAFSEGIVYVAQTTTFNTESQISAIDASTGAIKWEHYMDKHIGTKISVHENQICVVSDYQLPWPFEIALTILSDNGTSATEVWSHFKPYDSNESYAKPRRATFDGLGHIYFEEDVTDTTYIHSYNVSDGQENWETKLCNFGLPEPFILYGNGIITASYKSDESWAIVNSIVTLEASTGNIIKQNDDVVLNDSQVLLTGDNSTLVFNRLLNDEPTLQVYDLNGDLINTFSADYLGMMVTSLVDCKITSEGNLVIIDQEKVMAIEANFTPALSGTWSCRKGTNGNTNSIN